MQRTPWTEPITRWERASVRVSIRRQKLRYWRKMGVWQAIARRAPRTLIYAATLRAVAESTRERNCGPDEIRFPELVRPFEPTGTY